VHNRRLCEQELESAVVNLEPGLNARLFPWLQPGSPERRPRGAIRWPGGHTFLMWPTSDCRDSQAPLDCAMFLLKAPLPRIPRQPVVGHIKTVWPSGSYRLSRLSASSGGPGCSQGKKRVFKPNSNLTTIASSSCSNNLELRLANSPPTPHQRLHSGHWIFYDLLPRHRGGYVPTAPSGRQMGHIRTGQFKKYGVRRSKTAIRPARRRWCRCEDPRTSTTKKMIRSTINTGPRQKGIGLQLVFVA
jgi:hypothetical protein